MIPERRHLRCIVASGSLLRSACGDCGTSEQRDAPSFGCGGHRGRSVRSLRGGGRGRSARRPGPLGYGDDDGVVSGEVETAAAVVAIGGGAAAAYRAATTAYRRTIGSRRDHAARFNRLAAGLTREYVEAAFGPPAFRSQPRDGEIGLIYVTPHAYLQIGLDETAQAVERFAITVTDERFAFRTRHLTFGNLDVHLGRSTFGDVDAPAAGTQFSLGARRFACARAYYFGNPGGYQHYVLAHNDAGTGEWSVPPDLPGSGGWADGVLRPPDTHDPGGAGDVPPPWLEPALAGATVNTLAVVGPGARAPVGWAGVDMDVVRLLRA